MYKITGPVVVNDRGGDESVGADLRAKPGVKIYQIQPKIGQIQPKIGQIQPKMPPNDGFHAENDGFYTYVAVSCEACNASTTHICNLVRN